MGKLTNSLGSHLFTGDAMETQIRTRQAMLAALILTSALFMFTRVVSGEEADTRQSAIASEDKTFRLGEVVVSSEKLTSELVTTTTEVTRDDFRMRGMNTAAEALQYIPGGKVSYSRGSLTGNGKNESLIRLRGFETTDTSILIDGMPLTEPYTKRVDMSQILLDNVAKIKVIKGPSSVLYGPNTMGGIVNIISEQGNEYRTSVDQRFGDYMSFRTLAQTKGAPGPVNYILGGCYDTSNGFPVSHDFGGAVNQAGTLRENSDFERYNVTGRVGTAITDKGSVSLGGSYYSSRGGVPYSMSDWNPQLWRKDWDVWYVNAFAEWKFLENLGVKGQGFYNGYNNKIKTYTDPTFQQIDDNGRGVSTHDNDLYGFFLNPWWDLGRWSFLRAGIRYDNESVKTQDEIGDSWDRFKSEVYSLAIEDTVRILENLSFVAGVAYNHFHKVQALVDDAYKNPGADTDSVDFQVGVLYSPIPELELHAGVARKSSFPTLRQLYSANGFADLETQEGYTYEVGVEGSFGIPRLGQMGGYLSLFRSDVDNLISRYEKGNEVEYRNVAEALLQGLEMSLYWNPWAWLGLYVNYTFLDTENKLTGEPLDYRPANVVNFEARYQSDFGLTAGSIYSYTSSQKYEPTAQPDLQYELPAYGLWEIYLSQKFPFARESKRFVEVYLDVQNVLDEYYEEDPTKAAPGRRIWVGLRGAF